MWTEIVRQFLTWVMPLVLFFNGISFTVPHTADNYPAKIEYAYSNDTAGSAAGTVTLSASLGGSYDLFWGDENGNKLYEAAGSRKVYYSEFAEVDVRGGNGSVDILPFTAIPDGAETVLAYKGAFCCGVTEIEESKQADSGEVLYTFGALSDVHFNRDHSPVEDNSVLTFSNALNFLDKFDVKLVAMSGDVSRNYEEDSFIKFHQIAAEHDYPVYTCTGNHDVQEGFRIEDWYNYMNVGVYNAPIAPGIQAVNRETLDFVYAPDEAKGDVFIFLSHTQDNYSDNGQNVSPEQLDWLGEQLEKYKDSKVYLFYHSFLPNDNGNPYMCEGNILGPDGEYYSCYAKYGRADDLRLREFLQTYKNVVFFNGHSHIQFDMQKYNPDLNITNYGGKYTTLVHIPSVSVTRVVGGEKGSLKDLRNLRGSQGYLAKVYADRIVLTGVDFMRGKFVSYATYTIGR